MAVTIGGQVDWLWRRLAPGRWPWAILLGAVAGVALGYVIPYVAATSTRIAMAAVLLVLGVMFVALCVRPEYGIAAVPLFYLFSSSDPDAPNLPDERHLLVLLFLLWFAHALLGRPVLRPEPALGVAAAAFIAIQVLAVGQSTVPPSQSMRALLSMPLRFLVVYLPCQFLLRERSLRRCVHGMLILLAAMIVVTAAVVADFGDLTILRGVAQFGRTNRELALLDALALSNPNRIARAVLLCLPFVAVAHAYARRWGSRALLLVLFVGGSVLIGATLSRAGIAVWVVVNGLIALLMKPSRRLLVVAIPLILAVAIPLIPSAVRVYERKLEQIETPERESRVRLFWAAMGSFADRPFLGAGPGSQVEQMWRYGGEGLTDTDDPRGKRVAMAHNNLLLILVENGLLGLLAFLTLIGVFARRIRQLLRGAPTGYVRDVSLAGCIGLVSAFLMGMTAATFVETIWWYVAGLTLAAARQAATAQPDGEACNPWGAAAAQWGGNTCVPRK
jgi:O-antigen ligase